MTLGAKLIELRNRKRISQAEIASKLNVSQSAYNKWESDASKPTIENFLKLCEFYEVNIYNLLYGLSNIAVKRMDQIISNNTDLSKNLNTPIDLVITITESQKQITKLIAYQNELIKKLLP